MFSLVDKVTVVMGSIGLLGKPLMKSLRSCVAEGVGVDINSKEDSEHDYLIDITDEASVESVVEKIIIRFGRIV